MPRSGSNARGPRCPNRRTRYLPPAIRHRLLPQYATRYLEQFGLRRLLARLFLMAPLHLDAFGEIEQLASDGLPAHHLYKTGDLDLLRLRTGAAARTDHDKRFGSQGDQLETIPLAFLDEKELIM